MERKHNKQLVPPAKQMRKEMSREEKHLWYDFLRTYPVRFSRKKVLGRYIVDFYSAEAKLVIELDGYGQEEDARRAAFLAGYGLKVIWISKGEIGRNFQGVCRTIDEEVSRATGRRGGGQSLSQLR